jgi:type IV pilus assembly protein PilE
MSRRLRYHAGMRGQSGFTLIELVIAMAIVALLAAIALPAYTGQIRKGNRAVAKATLTQLLQREEAFFSDRKSYAATLTALGFGADTVYACKDGNTNCTSGSGIYTVTVCNAGNSPSGLRSSSGATIACVNPTATAVWMMATPVNQQAADTQCGTMVVNTAGIKGQTGAGAAGLLCWKS